MALKAQWVVSTDYLRDDACAEAKLRLLHVNDLPNSHLRKRIRYHNGNLTVPLHTGMAVLLTSSYWYGRGRFL
jgi:hypothetical protein